MTALWRSLAVAIVAVTMCLVPASLAAAQELEIELFAPQDGITGQPVEIAAFVREAGTGRPVEGATVVFFGDASFAGVAGDIELGRATTNEAGFAILRPSFSVSRVHEIRVEMLDAPEVAPVTVSIAVSVGLQIIEPEAGISIPGLGAWIVTLVIAAVWAIMIVAAFGFVAVSRSGKEAEAVDRDNEARRHLIPQLSIAPLATGIMILLGIGLVVLLIRSPESHSNLDPEGYDRTAVAYLEATYVYPGPGHAPAALTGDTVTDGRVLFMSYGCAGCHGVDGQGTSAARTPAFATRPWLETVVRAGLPGGMPAYGAGEVTTDQIDLIHAFLLEARDQITALGGPSTTTPVVTTTQPTTAPGETPTAVGFEEDIAPLFNAECSTCHGSAGGWSAATYREVVESGDNGPAVIPGDIAASLLAQKVSGTQTSGAAMPPVQQLQPGDVALILAWIQNGAPERVVAGTGASLYADRCAVCHGAAGEGGAGPPLTGPPLPPSDIVSVVADGRGAMGGFAASLTPDEISQVAGFTVTLGEAVPGDGPSLAGGAEVFRLHCARCHADDASGDVGPALTISTLTTDQNRTVIADGRSEMPAFGEALSSDDIEAVLLFLEDRRASAGPDLTTAPTGTGVPHPGSELYAAACATCHGADARGGVASGLAGTVLSANEVIARVYGGHEGGMPAFEGVLSADNVLDVASYVLELEGDESRTGIPPIAIFGLAALALLLVAAALWRTGWFNMRGERSTKEPSSPNE